MTLLACRGSPLGTTCGIFGCDVTHPSSLNKQDVDAVGAEGPSNSE
jgi:hypothetical protein